MKKIVFIILIVVAIVACNDDNDSNPRYVSVGSIVQNEGADINFLVKLDNGKILTPFSNYDNYNEVEDGDRVLVEFSIIEEKSDDAYDVDIYDIKNILTKGVMQLTEQNQDSIGNDPVSTSDVDIWVSENHLNIVFYYYGFNQTHLINLVKPIGEPTHDEEGRLILELRHNENNDFSEYLLSGIVSFEMDDLRISDELSLDFVVKVIGFNDEAYEYTGTYEFDNPNASNLPNFLNRKLLRLSDSKSR